MGAALILSAGWPALAAQDRVTQSEGPREGDPAANGRPVVDAAVTPTQDRLLDLAFDAAAAIPDRPHVVDRSRAMEVVATTSFELDLPNRALGYIRHLPDWRQAGGFADYAFYLAEHGDLQHVQLYLTLATEGAEKANDWQRDRIRVKVARVLALTGMDERAVELERGVTESESGKVDAVRVRRTGCSPEEFDSRIAALARIFEAGQFDGVRNAVEVCIEIVRTEAADSVRRERAIALIRSGWKPLPIPLRIEALMSLAEVALDRADKQGALAFVHEAREMMDAFTWSPEPEVALRGRLAGLRFRAGEEAEAKQDGEGTLKLFLDHKERIVNIYRGRALRPLAESWMAMHDSAAAAVVYGMVLEEGIVNINSRPRAEDLSATCASMALAGFEPDEAMWARMTEIRAGLRDPW